MATAVKAVVATVVIVNVFEVRTVTLYEPATTPVKTYTLFPVVRP
jgi:hypothetical protein